jgi:hypothetical protein
MSLLRGWLKPDYTKPKERFIDLDGAPYDCKPDDAHPIRRAVQAPVFKTSVIAGILLGTTAALGVNQSAKQRELLIGSFSVAVTSLFKQSNEAKRRRNEYPSLGETNVVIDKTGRASGDPEVLLDVDDNYQSVIERTPKYTGVIILAACGIAAWGFHGAGTSAALGAGIGIGWGVLASVPFTAQAAWAAYARRQLQNRRWTVTTSPPSLEKEAEETARPTPRSARLCVGDWPSP